MRQRDDPEFAACLKRFHIGKASDVNVNFINSRQIDLDTTLSTLEFKSILLTSNLLRVAFNRTYTKIFANIVNGN
jgi:hypothetical protein